MSVKSLLFFLLVASTLTAQNLVPYQVQDLKNWDSTALWGYKNLDFKIVIAPMNEFPNSFFNGYAKFQKDKKIGLIDSTGKVVIEPIYEEISNVVGDYTLVKPFSGTEEFMISVKTKKKFEYKKTIPNQHIYISNLPNIFILFSYDSNYQSTFGLIRNDGKIILEPKYSSLEYIGDNIFYVRDKSGNSSIFNVNDNRTMKLKYKELGVFCEGMASFQINNKYGFINNQGKEVIPAIYESPEANFQNGFVTLSNGEENLSFDKTGKMYFKGLGFKEIKNLTDNLFTVRADNDSLYIVGKDLVLVNSCGADEIAIIDSTGFLYRIGENIFFQTADTLTSLKMPHKKFTEIFAINTGYYYMECKTDSNTVLKMTLNKKFEVVAEIELNQKESGYFDWNSMGIVGKYFNDGHNDKASLVTYFDKTGKLFSDFKK